MFYQKISSLIKILAKASKDVSFENQVNTKLSEILNQVMYRLAIDSKDDFSISLSSLAPHEAKYDKWSLHAYASPFDHLKEIESFEYFTF